MIWVRLIISWAARRVKVSMRMRAGSTPFSTKCAVRCANVLVLPVPAPANISRGPASTPWSATGVPKVAARRCDGLSESNAVVLAFIMEAMPVPVLYVYPDRDAIRLLQRSGSRIADLAREEADHRRQLFRSGFLCGAPVDSPHAQTNPH